MPAIRRGSVPDWMAESAPYDALALANPVSVPKKVMDIASTKELAMYFNLPFIKNTDDVVKSMVWDRVRNSLTKNDLKGVGKYFMLLKDLAKDYPNASQELEKLTRFLGE